MVVLIFCIAVFALLCILGFLEKRHNNKNLEKIPLRINVNGIRGKSTATRLITGILWEAGYKAIGKTTGTAARMMYWDRDTEQQIIRAPKGVNISEQIKVINQAAKCGANALVCECMAVRPEYQRVYQNEIIQSQITVITNVLEDHLEEMGPTTKQIAEAFANTIPENGVVVIPAGRYGRLFRQVAKERNSEVVVINDDEISPEFLKQFDYRLFEHNCAVALAVARVLGISDEVAYKGMLRAHPDPGALRVYQLSMEGQQFCMVNAFAANEPSSTLDIWDEISEEMPELSRQPVVLMNCRPDRVDRTRQFIHEFFKKIPNSILVAAGENTREITKAYQNKAFPNVIQYFDFDRKGAAEVIEKIKDLFPGSVVFCVGNIHGIGNDLLQEILKCGDEYLDNEAVAAETGQEASSEGKKTDDDTDTFLSGAGYWRLLEFALRRVFRH